MPVKGAHVMKVEIVAVNMVCSHNPGEDLFLRSAEVTAEFISCRRWQSL